MDLDNEIQNKVIYREIKIDEVRILNKEECSKVLLDVMELKEFL